MKQKPVFIECGSANSFELSPRFANAAVRLTIILPFSALSLAYSLIFLGVGYALNKCIFALICNCIILINQKNFN